MTLEINIIKLKEKYPLSHSEKTQEARLQSRRNLCIFIFTFSRRVKYITELGLARALGMNFKQIFKLMFTEPLLLFVYSGIPGAFTGALFLMSYLTFFNPLPSNSLPFFLNWNIPTLLFIFGILLAITIIAGLMNSTLAMRANISKILKVE